MVGVVLSALSARRPTHEKMRDDLVSVMYARIQLMSSSEYHIREHQLPSYYNTTIRGL